MILSGSSDDPSDVYVNTFWFNSIQPTKVAMGELAAEHLDTCYSSFMSFMSGVVRSPMRVKTYSMADAPPREPYEVLRVIPGGGTIGIGNLPNELACCLSYHGAPPVTPRRRGRLYIGPLNAKTLNSTGGPNEPHDPSCWGNSFHTQLGAAFLQFLNSPAGGDWVVHGKGGDVPVRGGWVDSAYDIQRRRGGDAEARMLWGNI